MSLKERLGAAAPRESSGPRSANRFDFQKNWALCHLLAIHRSGQDYVLIFDYHDDVLELDSEIEPTIVKAYQVKSKKAGNWTLTDLLRRDPGSKEGTKLPSTIAKLYSHCVQFGDPVASLTFISNARFNVKLEDGRDSLTLDLIVAREFEGKLLKKVCDQIKTEHGLTDLPDLGRLLRLHVTELSLADHSTHASGKLAAFLDAISPSGRYRLAAAYTAVTDEIRRKNNSEQLCSSFDELLKHKSITRSMFSDMIATLGVKVDLVEAWNRAESRLNSESTPFGTIRELKRYWDAYEVERMDASNALLQSLRRAIVAELKSVTTSTLGECLDAVASKVRPSGSPFGLAYVKAMVLMELFDEDNQSQTTNPQSTAAAE